MDFPSEVIAVSRLKGPFTLSLGAIIVIDPSVSLYHRQLTIQHCIKP
jgi:hypothetical protein